MKKIIEVANEAYYNSENSILTDKEFDLLSDSGLEIKNFRNKTDHFQPMGSLKKIKTKEDYEKWRKDQTKINLSPKLDGNSIELVLENSKIKKAITRGDGFIGNDITDKIQYCNLVIFDSHFKRKDEHSIKCEAIMLKSEQEKYDKNIRNVVSGILGSKDIKIEELQKIHIIEFEKIQEIHESPEYEILEDTFNSWKKNYSYEIDGIVVSHLQEIYEEKDELIPENTISLKFNKSGVSGEIHSIEWNLGKYGRLTPVLILKYGINIDGTTVKRVSASNYGLLNETGLWPGAKVKVIKSGDIIPFISEIVEKSDKYEHPVCPKCGSKAKFSENGIHAICEECTDDEFIKLKHIFNVFDLEFISDSTIELLYENGYNKIEDYFLLKQSDILGLPGIGNSKANNIISKLKGIEISESQILKCTMIEGLGEKQCQKLIEHFGSIQDFLCKSVSEQDISRIDGFGSVLAKRIIRNMENFKETYNILSKYTKIKLSKKMDDKELNLPNVVFTGKCELYNRKELTSMLEEYGYNVQSGVNKETNLLITSDPNSNSSKTKKAKDLGIKIVNYDEFLLKKFPEFLI